jgi:hypothetical protein
MIQRLGVWVFVLLGVLIPLWATEYSYSYLPKQVYTTQVFPVTLLASHADPDRPVRFVFDGNGSIKPLGLMPAQVINGHDIFYTFYFQAKGEDDVRIPPLKIIEQNATITLPARSIHTEVLETNRTQNFCGLIATDCSIQAAQVSTFDSNHTLVSLTLQAHEGNPEAIHIPGSIEEGIERITRSHSSTIAEIYFVIPSSQKSITLRYYNTVQHRFLPTTIATDYRNTPVAAQVELNPKASPFDQVKKYGSVALAIFFALMFWWRRDWLYLILLVVILLLIYAVYKPTATLCIQEGSSLYILPTHNSRSSTTITEELHTPSLGEHGDYDKINYRHGIIGWIRHEDFCQN